MDRSFHYLLMAAQALFQKRVMGELEGTGLTTGQPKVLDYLGRHDGSVQKEIAQGCQIDPATMTGLLSRMEEKGLIVRRSEGGDRRSLHVYLTEAGWAGQRAARRALEAQGEAVLADLTDEERECLLSCLCRICGRMTDLEALQ